MARDGRKAQASLNYALLVIGAILVAAIVLAIFTGIPEQLMVKERAMCSTYQSFSRCEADPACTPIGRDAQIAMAEHDFYKCT